MEHTVYDPFREQPGTESWASSRRSHPEKEQLASAAAVPLSVLNPTDAFNTSHESLRRTFRLSPGV